MMTSLSGGSAATRVEKATSQLLSGPDWALNLDICDMINMDRWQTKEVVKAIKKRLQHKHPKVQFLSLMLLETMMKNCGDAVRSEVAQHDILQEMTKIVKKQNDYQVRDKALVLLDSWQEAFGGPGSQFPQYYWAYIELKRIGVQFPRRAPDAPLTFTNATSASLPNPNSSNYGSNYQNYAPPNPNFQPVNERPPTEISNMSVTELHTIKSALELLSEMLRAINPSDRMAIKDEIITDLVTQCRSNQKRLVQLINSTGDEVLLGEALALNDSLQNVIEKHDGIASGSVPLQIEAAPPVVRSSPVQTAPPVPVPVPVPPPVVEEKKAEKEEEEDDEFAELARRKSKAKNIEQEASSSSGITTEEPIASNALVPIDLPPPPPPSSSSSKQQDMIDLLTLALYDSPQSPSQSSPFPSVSDPNTPPFPSVSDPNASHFPAHSDALAVVPVSSPSAPPPAMPPQPYNYNPYNPYNGYNGYVASWAQPAQPAQPPAQPYNPYNYPSNPYAPYQNNAPYQPMQSAPPVMVNNNNPPSYVNPSFSAQPMQRFDSFGRTNTAANAPVASVSRQMERMGSFNNGMNSGGAPALKKEMPSAPKPYYMPDSLFGDLIDLKSKPSGSGSSQPMLNGKK